MGVVADTIRTKLEAAFSPQRLEVVDASERHRGHGGWREGGETHFDVVIVSELSRAWPRGAPAAGERGLGEELSGPVHALSIGGGAGARALTRA
jgi:BolA protein